MSGITFKAWFVFLVISLANLFTFNVSAQNPLLYRYFVGSSEPPGDWREIGFDDSAWQQGHGCIGYGDGDDEVIIDHTNTVYLRYRFTDMANFPDDLARIIGFVMDADFDDGFIAWLNGKEILRLNVDTTIENPIHTQTACRSHEAISPRYQFRKNYGYFIDSALFNAGGLDVNSILAIQVFNDSINSPDLSFYLQTDFIYDTADVVYDYVDPNIPEEKIFHDFYYSYKRIVPLDSSLLPIVLVNTDEDGFERPYSANSPAVMAQMAIVNNSSGDWNKSSGPFNEYNGPVRIKVRGGLSSGSPKMSFSFETQDSLGNNRNVSLLGLPDENDWILYGPYIDKSLIRNELVFEWGRKLGYYEPRTRFCELILNGENQGMYILTEKIKRDKNRLDIAKLEPTENSDVDLTGGYIFTIDHMFEITVKYPDEEVITQQQTEYITNFYQNYINVLMGEEFMDPEKGYRKYIDPSSLIDFILITELTRNLDGFLGSVFMYKDKDDIDPRIHFGPLWDYDLSMRNYNQYSELPNRVTGWQSDYSWLLNINRYLQDSAFVDDLIERWFELRKGLFDNHRIDVLVDEIIEPLKPSIERNYQVWPVIDKPIIYFDTVGITYKDEITEMKSWLAKRAEWIDNHINEIQIPVDIQSKNGFGEGDDQWVVFYPNPFSDRLSGTIYSKLPGEIDILFYDLAGHLQLTIKKNVFYEGNSELQIDEIAGLGAGIYLVEVRYMNGFISRQKLIKVKQTN